MSGPLVLMCSPHAGGVSDTLAHAFASGLEDAGSAACCLALCEHPVLPCTGCGACARPPHACVLADRDEAELVFSRVLKAPLVLLASPIFFYALPATFKAWIDRGQRFWASRAHKQEEGGGGPGAENAAARPMLAVLAAGRPRGEELFSGALRTLRWFAPVLGAYLAENKVFRGLDRLEDLEARPELLAAMRHWGCEWGQRLMGTGAPGGKARPL